MATAILLPTPELQFCDADGTPYAGGSIATYVPGTTTPKATWVDPGEAALNTNPIILDAAGRCIIYGSGDYRLILRDAAGNLIYDQLSSTVVSDAMLPVVSAPTIADAVNLLGIDALIAAEATARANADSAEQTARIAAVGTEADTRASGDAYLQSEIDAINATLAGLGGGSSVPLIQGGSDLSASDGHKRVTFPTAYSSAPAIVVSVAGAGYGAECIVVHTDNTGLDVWFAFPATSGPVPVGPINFMWIATGSA